MAHFFSIQDMLANVSADTNQRWLQQIDAEEIHLDNNGHGLHTPLKPQPSSNSTTASTYTYPVTPDLSPNQIQQLQQRKQQWYERNRSHALLNQSRSFPAQLDGSHYDGFSDADTIDREVAATTSGLGLPAPDQHPYYGIVDRSASYQNSSLHPQATLDHVPEATHPTGHKSQRRKSVVTPHSHQSITEQAFEALQTQVAALTEQLDHMKQRLAEKEQIKRQMRWSWLWMAKTVGKHALINLVILVLLFLVLLKRRSPIAYALLGYATPRIKSLLTSLQHRLTSRHVSV
ncbi:hypothetical protein DM01DRAFT_1001331 [Hesseltinella vesiculosa]|uniref:Uncharacterized protein n=1 Tax=Hesseltinella vesiculosa TaxID=101127 RepID=A0A1X2GWZ9_9FUNG|nr:hypothetical protein DM01DRAFT_1001331 [Hesseltinella vesiculosa]